MTTTTLVQDRWLARLSRGQRAQNRWVTCVMYDAPGRGNSQGNSLPFDKVRSFTKGRFTDVSVGVCGGTGVLASLMFQPKRQTSVTFSQH